MVQARAAYSPSGDEVAFVARERDRTDCQLYVADSDGNAARRLPVHAKTIKAPDGSRDGQSIAFSGHVEGQTDIFVIGRDGRRLSRLTEHSSEDGEPSWSPDGRRLVFCSNRTGTYQLYVMNADGTGVHRLFENEANEFQPEWAPDGSEVIVESHRNEANWLRIYRVHSDGDASAAPPFRLFELSATR